VKKNWWKEALHILLIRKLFLKYLDKLGIYVIKSKKVGYLPFLFYLKKLVTSENRFHESQWGYKSNFVC